MDHVIHGVLSAMQPHAFDSRASVKKSLMRLFPGLVRHACLGQGVGRGTEAPLYAIHIAHVSLDQFACSKSDSVSAFTIMPHCHGTGDHALPVRGHLPDRARHDQRSAVVRCTSPASSLSGMSIVDFKQWQAQIAMAFQLTFRWTNWRA